MSTKYRIKDTQLVVEADDVEPNSLLITRVTDKGLYSVISIRRHETRELSIALAYLAQKYEEDLSAQTQRTVH